MNEDRKNELLINRKKFKASLSAKNLFEKLILGDKTALSTSITLLESALVSDQEKAKELLDLCLPFSGKSFRIGITGIPGVGKSSFIEEFGKIVCEKGHKLAVLAIDPSSEKTGGSILGDKTRMQD
ncbi:MAG: methylmalonyl Co-A mutase-associated GTPase MeaB, partial [Fluviicola sp.]